MDCAALLVLQRLLLVGTGSSERDVVQAQHDCSSSGHADAQAALSRPRQGELFSPPAKLGVMTRFDCTAALTEEIRRVSVHIDQRHNELSKAGRAIDKAQTLVTKSAGRVSQGGATARLRS